MKPSPARRLAEWAVCHGLLIAALLLPASFTAFQLTDIHWGFALAYWALLAAGVFLAFFHTRSHGRGSACSRVAVTAEDLTKLRYRFILAAVRSLPIVVTIGGILFVTLPLVFSSRHRADDFVSLRATAVVTVFIWFTMSLLAAFLFRARNAELFPASNRSALGQSVAEHVHRADHHSHWITSFVFPLYIISAIGPDSGRWNSAHSAIGLLLIASFAAGWRHGRELCEICVTEFRVDAPGYAASKRWIFTIGHKGQFTFAISATAGCVIDMAFRGFFVTTASLSLMACATVAVTFTNRFHRKYQPWCPYCHPGDGGQEHTEIPDPTGGHDRPVPA